MALTDTQQTMHAYFRDLLNRGDYSRHYSDDAALPAAAVGRSRPPAERQRLLSSARPVACPACQATEGQGAP
jgi:hypothetical protein